MKTPRTDEVVIAAGDKSMLSGFVSMTNHARQLERELIESQENVRWLREAMATMARNALKGMEATK